MNYEEFSKCLEYMGFSHVDNIHENIKLQKLTSQCWGMLKGKDG